MSGDSCGCHTLGKGGFWQLETRTAAKHLTVHGIAPTTNSYPIQNVDCTKF